MTGRGDTTRGSNSRRHIAPPAEAQEEQPRLRKCHLKKKSPWQTEEDPVGYLRKKNLDEMKI